MAKGKPSVQTAAARNNNTGQVKTPAPGVASTGNNFVMGKRTDQAAKTPAKQIPRLEIGSRFSPFAAMLADPVHGKSALPPVTMSSRAVAFPVYQEILLGSDASGNTGCIVNPRMKGQANVITGWTGTTITTIGAGIDNSEYTSFNNNYYAYVPLVVEVRVRFTGSMTAVAGRMYGIVSPNAAGGTSLLDVTAFPLEPNGCEAVTSDGISCTWYSTSSIWNNPMLAASTTVADAVTDTQIIISMIGGPASASNILTVGVYMHLAAFPKFGVCGIVPSDTIPDVSAAHVAHLMQAASSGHAQTSMSLVERDRKRKNVKGHIRDVVRVGGQILGHITPYLGAASTAAEALALLLA